MELELEKNDDIAIVTVPVEYLDGSNDGTFKEGLFSFLEDHRRMILDLSQVEFIDSTGCGAMIAAVKQLRSSGGDLKICSITKPVRALFDLIGIKTVIGIYSTREEAIQAFSEEASARN